MSQLALPFPLRERMNFAGFVSAGNEELVARLRHAHFGFSALWLHGTAFSGKTHLLQASCSDALHVSSRSGASGRVLYLPAKDIRAEDALPGLFERADIALLCVDDCDAWLGDPDSEALIMSVYQHVLESEGQLLLSAALPALDTRFALPDLASRLRAAQAFHVTPPAEQFWAQLLKRRAAGRGFELDDRVLDFWLARGPRSFEALMQQLDAIDAATLHEQRKVTVPFLKRQLGIV
ncbi:MAG: DnaA/Hda family protein [Pseudomonadaceae bacterium]|nr:DnaA/Hda family protein [Pseudomonadaceae bacterium]